MVWTTADNVRLITGLTTSDISDDNLNSLIQAAQKEVLLHINQKETREPIEYIDSTRENDIDGTNTTYYVKNWEGKYLSDSDYDLDIDTSDITVYSVSKNDGTETTLTVSSITYNQGKFVLSSAPEDVDLYVDYCWTYFNPSTPHPLLKLATEYLAGAYAYMRKDSSQVKQIKFGNTSITNSVGADSSYNFLYNKYVSIIQQLNENTGNGAIWGESKVKI